MQYGKRKREQKEEEKRVTKREKTSCSPSQSQKGANWLGRYPSEAGAVAVASGVGLLAKCAARTDIKNLTTIFTNNTPFYSGLSGLFLLSTGHALSRNYKPKASKFPFGHTSTKRVLLGSASLRNSLMLLSSSFSILAKAGTTTTSAAVALGVGQLPLAAFLGYIGISNIAKGFGFQKQKKLPSFPDQDKDQRGETKKYQPECFQVKADCHFEHLAHGSYMVWRVPGYEPAPSITEEGLSVVDASVIFKPGTVALGFGFPNVFMLKFDPEIKKVMKVSAFCAKRKDMEIVTSNNVQAGLFLVPSNLPSGVLETVSKIARKEEGKRGPTCVQTNATIMQLAGFSVKGKKLSDYLLPHTLLQDILELGLCYQGKPVDFHIVNLSPMSLTQALKRICDSVYETPKRHLQKALSPGISREKKQERIKEMERIFAQNMTRIQKIDLTEEDKQQNGTEAKAKAKTMQLMTSVPSRMGKLARKFWGPHPLILVSLKGIDVSKFLPSYLQAFQQDRLSWSTLLKRDVLFSPLVLEWLSSNLAESFTSQGTIDVHNLLNLLPRTGERRNFVITDDVLGITIVQEGVGWALCKHVLSAYGLSSKLDDAGLPMVRGSGEVWADSSGTIFMNRNSGTYTPSEKDLQNMGRLAEFTFQIPKGKLVLVN